MKVAATRINIRITQEKVIMNKYSSRKESFSGFLEIGLLRTEAFQDRPTIPLFTPRSNFRSISLNFALIPGNFLKTNLAIIV